MSAETCPLCGVSLRGEPIPEKWREHEADCPSVADGTRCFCLPYGDKTHFNRVIGHEVRGVYDGVLFWQCPDCLRAWSRDWSGYGRRAELAACYVQQFNDMADDVQQFDDMADAAEAAGA